MISRLIMAWLIMQSCQPSRFWRKAYDFRAENTPYDFTLYLRIYDSHSEIFISILLWFLLLQCIVIATLVLTVKMHCLVSIVLRLWNKQYDNCKMCAVEHVLIGIIWIFINRTPQIKRNVDVITKKYQGPETLGPRPYYFLFWNVGSSGHVDYI